MIVVVDSQYIHEQIAPLDVWVIDHNLNKFATVFVLDSSENIIEGDVHYNSLNQITLTFSKAVIGKAIIG